MLIRSLFVFVTIGFAASADLDCETLTLGQEPGTVCTKIVTPSTQSCGGIISTTVIISSKVNNVAASANPTQISDAASANLDCGNITPQSESGDESGGARLGEAPWHVGVYGKAFNPYKQVCEGTLVSATVVISAAHCYWNATKAAELAPRQPAARYAVAAGKLYRAWDANDGYAHKSDVLEIHIPVRFRSSITNYQDDIAVLKLAAAVQFNSAVRPACLDFDYTFEETQLAPGNYGKMASWSIPEAESGDERGRRLQIQELPYVDIPQCFNEAPPSFRPYITSDKFCAFAKDSFTVVCRGAAGAGLVFQTTQPGVTPRHYLRGVTSAAAVYRPDGCSQFIGFTQLSRHEHFIKQHL